VQLLADDVTPEPLLPVDGHLPVRRAVTPDRALVKADDQTRQWWLRRMEAAQSRLNQHAGR
jgi:O-succinylbenzoate synthase